MLKFVTRFAILLAATSTIATAITVTRESYALTRSSATESAMPAVTKLQSFNGGDCDALTANDNLSKLPVRRDAPQTCLATKCVTPSAKFRPCELDFSDCNGECNDECNLSLVSDWF